MFAPKLARHVALFCSNTTVYIPFRYYCNEALEIDFFPSSTTFRDHNCHFPLVAVHALWVFQRFVCRVKQVPWKVQNQGSHPVTCTAWTKRSTKKQRQNCYGFVQFLDGAQDSIRNSIGMCSCTITNYLHLHCMILACTPLSWNRQDDHCIAWLSYLSDGDWQYSIADSFTLADIESALNGLMGKVSCPCTNWGLAPQATLVAGSLTVWPGSYP